MKKFRILTIILVVSFLFGCSQGAGESQPQFESANQTKFPDKIEIFSSLLFSSDNPSLDAWVEYMNDTYSTEFIVDNTTSPFAVKDQISSGDRTGFALLRPIQIIELADEGKILPLDEYLKDNKTWNALPDSYKNIFKYKGHIWALSRNDTKSIKASSIRTDWLKNVGLKVPQTVEQLNEAGKAFLKKDANGDGDYTNDYLMGNGQYAGYCMQLLVSYGIYLDRFDNIMYDPNDNCIEDSMFKPQAREALDMLRSMMKAGMVGTDENSDNNDEGSYGIYTPSSSLSTNIIGAKYNIGNRWAINNEFKVFNRKYEPENESDYNYAAGLYEVLPPLSKDYPMTYSYNGSGYVLAKGTEQPGETINAFVDMVFGSQNSFLNTYLGQSDRYTKLSNNTILINETYNMPLMIDAPYLVFGLDFAVSSNESVLANHTAKREEEMLQYEKDYVDRYTKTGQLVEVPAWYCVNGSTYKEKGSFIQQAYKSLISSLAISEKSTDELLSIYRNTAVLYNIKDILKESNENLGLTNKQEISDKY